MAIKSHASRQNIGTSFNCLMSMENRVIFVEKFHPKKNHPSSPALNPPLSYVFCLIYDGPVRNLAVLCGYGRISTAKRYKASDHDIHGTSEYLPYI